MKDVIKGQLVDLAKEIESTEDGFIQWMLVMQYDGLAQEAINEGSITQDHLQVAVCKFGILVQLVYFFRNLLQMLHSL